jgi:hypothetical protein
MKNTLFDLQNHIFEKIEKLNDDDLQGDEAKIEVAKAMAINELSKSAIANIAMMAKFADDRDLSVDIPVFPETNKKRITG